MGFRDIKSDAENESAARLTDNKATTLFISIVIYNAAIAALYFFIEMYIVQVSGERTHMTIHAFSVTPKGNSVLTVKHHDNIYNIELAYDSPVKDNTIELIYSEQLNKVAEVMPRSYLYFQALLILLLLCCAVFTTIKLIEVHAIKRPKVLHKGIHY